MIKTNPFNPSNPFNPRSDKFAKIPELTSTPKQEETISHKDTKFAKAFFFVSFVSLWDYTTKKPLQKKRLHEKLTSKSLIIFAQCSSQVRYGSCLEL